MSTAKPTLPILVYESYSGFFPSISWKELWEYRELLYFLTWRDIKIRYKQAVLGVGWAILQPLLTMVVFTVIFGLLAKLPSEGVPYPLFSLTALLPWQLFSGALGRAGNSLVANSNLLTKVYFPRLVIPLSAILAGIVDFLVSFIILVVMILIYRIPITWAILTLPLFIILAMMAALAVGLWLSALNVKYRDVQYIIPFLIQVWMYASPVAYSSELIPQGLWRILYGLNPMAGVIQGFRWALLGSTPPDNLLWVSIVAVLVLLGSGFVYFQRMEEQFADVV